MAMGTGVWTPQDVARCPGACSAAKRGQEDVTKVQFCAISLFERGALRPTTSQDWSSAAFPTLGWENPGHCLPPVIQGTKCPCLVGNANPLRAYSVTMATSPSS